MTGRPLSAQVNSILGEEALPMFKIWVSLQAERRGWPCGDQAYRERRDGLYARRSSHSSRRGALNCQSVRNQLCAGGLSRQGPAVWPRGFAATGCVGGLGRRRPARRSGEARLESRSPEKVRVEADGTIRPVADGTAEVVVRFGSSETRLPSNRTGGPAAGGQLPQRGRAAS